jgi:lipopolysaccharide transport system ATP-binding protein
MSSSIAITVSNLSKCYLIGHQRPREKYTALRDVIARNLRGCARSLRDVASGRQIIQADEVEEFWALKDVSFEIKEGEAVGIIGRNGAGKSTLLKLLSRITEPTIGRIEINGRIASLLEVGTGFHPELTGRENIYLNGAILGMTRSEIKRKFDEIVDFAEIERFLDTPVKRYSSGMYVRLAFAVAAHLEPEILVVDEVLAVGDSQFQKKCLGKMQNAASHGRTILFVSHNMYAVSQLCSRAIVLGSGHILFDGETEDAIHFYLKRFSAKEGAQWSRPVEMQRPALSVETVKCEFRPDLAGDTLVVKVQACSNQPHKACFIAVDIRDPMGMSIMQAIPRLEPFIQSGEECHQIHVRIELPSLIPGDYFLGVWLGPHNADTIDHMTSTAFFSVSKSPTPGRIFPHHHSNGYIVPHCVLLPSNR